MGKIVLKNTEFEVSRLALNVAWPVYNSHAGVLRSLVGEWVPIYPNYHAKLP